MPSLYGKISFFVIVFWALVAKRYVYFEEEKIIFESRKSNSQISADYNCLIVRFMASFMNI
jgi:hypothetical protein